MATQGATLQRRGVQSPVTLIAALVALALATALTAVAMNVMDDARPASPVTSIQELDGTGPRGATLDAAREAKAFEAWSAAVRELPAGPFHEGKGHEVVVVSERSSSSEAATGTASAADSAIGLGSSRAAEGPANRRPFRLCRWVIMAA